MKLTKTDIEEFEIMIRLYREWNIAKPETSLEEVKVINRRQRWVNNFETRISKASAGILREETVKAILSREAFGEYKQTQQQMLANASDLTPPSEMPNLSEIERNNPE